MAKSINGTVTQTVVLGKHGYGSYLYITTAGVVLPGAGARGVVIPASIQRGEVSTMARYSAARVQPAAPAASRWPLSATT